jgi:hypothetical protein
MCDQKALAEEARLAILVVEAGVCSLDNQLKILQDKVSMFLHSFRNAMSLLVLHLSSFPRALNYKHLSPHAYRLQVRLFCWVTLQ